MEKEETEKLKERIAVLESSLPTKEMLKKEYAVLRLDKQSLSKMQHDIADACTPSGIWTRPISGSRGAYPTLLRRCAIGKEDMKSGKRACNAVMFTCSHIILVAHGFLPFNYGVHASHLCHVSRCCNIAHLRWELRYVNEERNRCIGKEECVCGQIPPCLPSAHAS